jgi:hypothetical protein
LNETLISHYILLLKAELGIGLTRFFIFYLYLEAFIYKIYLKLLPFLLSN